MWKFRNSKKIPIGLLGILEDESIQKFGCNINSETLEQFFRAGLTFALTTEVSFEEAEWTEYALPQHFWDISGRSGSDEGAIFPDNDLLNLSIHWLYRKVPPENLALKEAKYIDLEALSDYLVSYAYAPLLIGLLQLDPENTIVSDSLDLDDQLHGHMRANDDAYNTIIRWLPQRCGSISESALEDVGEGLVSVNLSVTFDERKIIYKRGAIGSSKVEARNLAAVMLLRVLRSKVSNWNETYKVSTTMGTLSNKPKP